MKVKVSYTVDFDDVPSLISNIVQECKQKLEYSASSLKFTPHDYEKMLQQIEQARIQLTSIDESLQDVFHLVAGWTSTINPPSSQITTHEEEQTDEQN